MIKNEFSLDHVGWITNDISKFESFWVHVLGFQLIATSKLGKERAVTLFGIESDADIRRYQLRSMVVEIHCFGENTKLSPTPFNREGINHVCLFVPDRDSFLAELPSTVKINTFNHPGGWKNIFLNDFEGNWIELRTGV